MPALLGYPSTHSSKRLGQTMGTVIVLGQTMDTGIVLHRWTLTMNTMTLSSTGQYWTATPGFADECSPPSRRFWLSHAPTRTARPQLATSAVSFLASVPPPVSCVADLARQVSFLDRFCLYNIDLSTAFASDLLCPGVLDIIDALELVLMFKSLR